MQTNQKHKLHSSINILTITLCCLMDISDTEWLFMYKNFTGLNRGLVSLRPMIIIEGVGNEIIYAAIFAAAPIAIIIQSSWRYILDHYILIFCLVLVKNFLIYAKMQS